MPIIIVCAISKGPQTVCAHILLYIHVIQSDSEALYTYIHLYQQCMQEITHTEREPLLIWWENEIISVHILPTCPCGRLPASPWQQQVDTFHLVVFGYCY